MENDLNDDSSEMASYSFNNGSNSNKFHLSQTKKELDDPFLRDLTACLQMKHKKLTELSPDFNMNQQQHQSPTSKVSPTFTKPSFSFQPTPFTELKLTSRATSPICIDSNGRLINSCSYSSISVISASSFNVVLKCSNASSKSSTLHNWSQTEEEFLSKPIVVNEQRQIKSISFIQPTSLVKLDDQSVKAAPLASLKSTEFRTPAPTMLSIRPIQKSDQDHLVKTKPYQLMSFNLESTPPVSKVANALSTISSKAYATTSTNTETNGEKITTIVTNRVDKYTNTDDFFLVESEVSGATNKKNSETQTQNNMLVDDQLAKSDGVRKQHGLELLSTTKSKRSKIDLENLLKFYLWNDFQKDDLTYLKGRLFELMAFLDTNSSLQIDNRRLTRLDNSLIKCLNRNMLIQNTNDYKVGNF
jgi:hypothetical protein